MKLLVIWSSQITKRRNWVYPVLKTNFPWNLPYACDALLIYQKHKMCHCSLNISEKPVSFIITLTTSNMLRTYWIVIRVLAQNSVQAFELSRIKKTNIYYLKCTQIFMSWILSNNYFHTSRVCSSTSSSSPSSSPSSSVKSSNTATFTSHTRDFIMIISFFPVSSPVFGNKKISKHSKLSHNGFLTTGS